MAYFSSALLRRWISSSSRSRTLTTAAAPPWLTLHPKLGRERESVFRFQSCESTGIYSFFSRISFGFDVVGSSHGWLALRNNNRNLFLSDPTIPRCINLPPLDELHRIILSEREGKAFAVFGQGRRLSFCSPQQSSEWTPFGGDKYESIVYSSSHCRLFCLTSTFRLEAWDVAGELPSLDWSTQFEIPEHLHKPGLTSLIYLVCWEASRDLFVVVRRLDPSRGRYFEVGAVLEFAHPTVDFEVYKVDREGRRVARVEASLEGLTMFVGMNHPFAIKGVEGVKPNAIYFAYDNHAATDIVRDCGIFDYQNKCVSQRSNHNVQYYEALRAIWFTPHNM